MYAETIFEQLISCQDLTAKIRRDKKKADHKPRDDVSNDNLQVRIVSTLLGKRVIRIRDRRHTDQSQRARLRRHDRQADDDPMDILRPDKIILDGLLRLPKKHAKDRDAHEIGKKDYVVDC